MFEKANSVSLQDQYHKNRSMLYEGQLMLWLDARPGRTFHMAGLNSMYKMLLTVPNRKLDSVSFSFWSSD